MTRIDRIRQMTAEEIADKIMQYGVDVGLNFCKERLECDPDYRMPDSAECRQCLIEWLEGEDEG